jgi:hypothetical protein
MLAVGALLLAVAVAPATGAPAASTWDEAACDDAAPAPAAPRLDADAEPDCSEPPVPIAPAVIDCNDARVSLWVGEMIGSCDMPRVSAPSAALRTPDGSGTGTGPRLCDGIRCHHDSTPLRPAARVLDDGGVGILARAAAPEAPRDGVALASAFLLRHSQAGRDRLDRPPRAC